MREIREVDGVDYFREVRGLGEHDTLRSGQVVDFLREHALCAVKWAQKRNQMCLCFRESLQFRGL